MRAGRAGCALAALVACCSAALAQPRLVIERRGIDLGEIDDSRVIDTAVTIRNAGDEALVIDRLHASCSCVAMSGIENDQKKFAPGESSTLLVRFNPSGRRGEVLQTLTITSNDPRSPESSVRVRAFVRPIAHVTPTYVRWNEVALGAGAEQVVQIWAEREDFRITGGEVVQDPLGRLEWSAGEPTRLEQDGEPVTLVEVTLRLRKDSPTGMAAPTLLLKTSDERRPEIALRTSAEIVGDLRCEPRLVTFNRADGGTRVERSFMVRSESGRAFRILGMEGGGRDGAYVRGSSPGSSEPRIAHQVTIVLDAPRENLILNGELVIKTDLPEEPEYRVPFSGVVRE